MPKRTTNAKTRKPAGLSRQQETILRACAGSGTTREGLHAAVFGHETAPRGAWQVRKPAKKTLTGSQRASLSRSLSRLMSAGLLVRVDGLYRTTKKAGQPGLEVDPPYPKPRDGVYRRMLHGYSKADGYDMLAVVKCEKQHYLVGWPQRGKFWWDTPEWAAVYRLDRQSIDTTGLYFPDREVWIARDEKVARRLYEEYRDEQFRLEQERERREAEQREYDRQHQFDWIDEAFAKLKSAAEPYAAALKFFGLDRTATAADVNRAYRTLALKAHPDAGGDGGAFRILQAQYELALHAVKKRNK